MGKRFNPRDLLGIQSLPQRREDQTIVYRDPRELIPTQENFYNTRNIEKLKASIKITGYLMQPILIENVNEKDRVLAGHRRRLCCIDLINEGDTRFEKVPCMYASEIKIPGMETLSLEEKEKIEPILRQFKVIQTNNYRDKSDWEKMQEFLEMEKIVKQFKESMGLKGNLRDELKELMGISGGQYSRYKKISNNLIEELMKEFKEEIKDSSITCDFFATAEELEVKVLQSLNNEISREEAAGSDNSKVKAHIDGAELFSRFIKLPAIYKNQEAVYYIF